MRFVVQRRWYSRGTGRKVGHPKMSMGSVVRICFDELHEALGIHLLACNEVAYRTGRQRVHNFRFTNPTQVRTQVAKAFLMLGSSKLP